MLLLASCLVIECKAPHRGPKFKYLDRALRPVVFPAHDDIALIWIMAVLAEAPGLVLELDSNPLPHPGLPANPPLGLAVGKPRLDDLDDVSEFTTDHAEEEDDPLLVDWCMLQAAEVDEVSVDVGKPGRHQGVVLLRYVWPFRLGLMAFVIVAFDDRCGSPSRRQVWTVYSRIR